MRLTGLLRRTANWRVVMGATTVVFSVWFMTVLYRFWIPRVVASWSRDLHGVVGTPTVSAVTVWEVVLLVRQWGLTLSVALFFVGFGLFHRATEHERGADADRTVDADGPVE